ncbi:MAG: hypothetical protein KGP28_08870, partial [Bdellovibrionales bacterium]|nr:hypothetical protein [Bdellovibrionales bacterium]
GSVRCWGYNRDGQLGNGSNQNSPTPVTVSGLTNAIAVSAGGNHTCALIGDGSVRCWGYNRDGQLGNGSNQNSPTPVTVSGLTNAIAVSAGGTHTCAIESGGSVKCWGDGSSGQTGGLHQLWQSRIFTQVQDFDQDPSSPLTEISANSPVSADGSTQSVVSIRITHPTGDPWVGITPRIAVTDTLDRNTVTGCTVTNSIGASSCTIASTFAETKQLILVHPFLVLAKINTTFGEPPQRPGDLNFTPIEPSRLVFSGPAHLQRNTCSSRPYAVRLADSFQNSVVSTTERSIALYGLSSVGIYLDPGCTMPASSTLPLSAGSSSTLFFLKPGGTLGPLPNPTASDGRYSSGLEIWVVP